MFGEHAAFIIPSYLITFSVLVGMTILIRINYSARKRELARLEDEAAARKTKG